MNLRGILKVELSRVDKLDVRVERTRKIKEDSHILARKWCRFSMRKTFDEDLVWRRQKSLFHLEGKTEHCFEIVGLR